MTSHCSFGHLKHKLWPKERPGVKLAIWLLTIKKSKIDPIYLGEKSVQHTVEKILTRVRTLLQTTFQSEVCLQSYRAPKPRESQFGRFRDSHKKAIWMWALRLATKYTIKGKVVASPKFGLWWVLCVSVARGSS